MKIRPYQPKDFENCRDICLVTSSGFNTPEEMKALWYMYCDYYLLYESDTCFIVANEKDEAIGYILCAKDYNTYKKQFKQHFSAPLRKVSLKHWLMHGISGLYMTAVARKYPAHLHIDIKPEGQRQGMGTKLVDALVAKLKESGVKGVHLGVGADNEKGVSFYKKYGFKEYKKGFGSIVFALDL